MALQFWWVGGGGTASGVNTGDETATRIGALIGGADDATPNDTDFVATSLTGGGILKKITWANVIAYLRSFFAPRKSFITLTADYTTPNNSSLKQLFDAPANGAFTAEANSTYFFECLFYLTGMSATPGTFSFGILGTATITSILAAPNATKTSGLANPTSGPITITGGTVVSVSNASTVGISTVSGKITVTNAGTIIPAFSTSQASATVVKAGSYFRIWKVGSNTVQSVGEWT